MFVGKGYPMIFFANVIKKKKLSGAQTMSLVSLGSLHHPLNNVLETLLNIESVKFLVKCVL